MLVTTNLRPMFGGVLLMLAMAPPLWAAPKEFVVKRIHRTLNNGDKLALKVTTGAQGTKQIRRITKRNGSTEITTTTAAAIEFESRTYKTFQVPGHGAMRLNVTTLFRSTDRRTGKTTWRKEVFHPKRGYSVITTDKAPISSRGPLTVEFPVSGRAPLHIVGEMRKIAQKTRRAVVSEINGVRVEIAPRSRLRQLAEWLFVPPGQDAQTRAVRNQYNAAMQKQSR